MTCPICAGQAAHLYAKDSFGIARCGVCETLFVENPPADTSSLYDDAYFFGGEGKGGYGSYDAEKEMMRPTLERCLDRISAHCHSGKLFDVGAATGYFLSLAQSRGFDVSGVELSPAAAREAKKRGIDVETGTLDAMVRPAASFDVVTLFDVLEHVSSPDVLVRRIADMLMPGGILMGSTPDSGSATARLLGRHWHLIVPPEHLVLLNDRSLRMLLSKHGFEILWTGRIAKRFSLPYIFQTASRWLGMSWLSRVGSALRDMKVGQIAIPLDLRDNVFFLARKKTDS